MMKWKAKKGNLNIGNVELDNLTFNEDYMEVSIDILNVSEELQTEINKSIEIAKAESVAQWKKWYGENLENAPHRRAWSDKPVVIQFHYLRIVLEEGKPNQYSIETGFEDAENDKIEAVASTIVDLSEYEEELKKEIIKVLIDRFF